MGFSKEQISIAQSALDQHNAKDLVAQAVRETLDSFAQQNPGRSVEVRVPPYRVVQIGGGATHRRGTPPAVVEMDPTIWLNLVTRNMKWADASAQGLIQASGVGSDLASLFD